MPFFAVQYTYRPAKAALRDQHRPVHREWLAEEHSAGNVLILGHPYVDVWQAVRPQALRIDAWPTVPRGEDWKTGVCRRLGWGTPQDGWRRVYNAVNSFRDLEAPLIGAVERLVDFVTEQP